METERNKGLKICYWNKANSKLGSRISEIKHIISEHKPAVIGISEANFMSNQDISLISINGYKCYLSPP